MPALGHDESTAPGAASAAVRVVVHGMANGGDGIGRAEAGDTRVWFVDGGLPGDTLRVEPVQSKPRMIRGRSLEVVTASPLRVAAPCSLAERCGGCGWQHVRPAAQAELKAQIVGDLLRKLGGPAPQAMPSPAALGYRRRARLHFEKRPEGLQLGFFARTGHVVIDAPACPVLEAPLRHAVTRMRAAAPLLPNHGELHFLSDGARVVVGIAAASDALGQRIPLPPLAGDSELLRAGLTALLDEVLVGVVVAGPRGAVSVGVDTLELDAAGPEDMSVRTGPFAFAQAQRAQNDALVAHVLAQAQAQRKGRGLELFAGAGNFTRGLSTILRELTAVETDGPAAAELQLLASRIAVRGGTRVQVKREPAATTLKRAAAGNFRFDLVVLDPPRAGLGTAAARDLVKVARGRVIHVSCDPATLARDLEVLTKGGLRIASVVVFDMMPMTPEVEVVAVLDVRARSYP
jgi:23S rRNA (uracil1939-C5)-methyltransferase